MTEYIVCHRSFSHPPLLLDPYLLPFQPHVCPVRDHNQCHIPFRRLRAQNEQPSEGKPEKSVYGSTPAQGSPCSSNVLQRCLKKMIIWGRGCSFCVNVHRYTESVLSIRQKACLLYTSPSPRDKRQSRMPSSA